MGMHVPLELSIGYLSIRCVCDVSMQRRRKELKSVAAIMKMNIINNMKSHVSLHYSTKLSKQGKPMP